MLRRGSDVLDVYRHERAAELMKLEKYDPKAFLQELHGNINVGDIKGTGTTKVFRDGKEVKTLHHTAILYEKEIGGDRSLIKKQLIACPHDLLPPPNGQTQK